MPYKPFSKYELFVRYRTRVKRESRTRKPMSFKEFKEWM